MGMLVTTEGVIVETGVAGHARGQAAQRNPIVERVVRAVAPERIA
jgi:hypothetical protein